MKKKNLLDIRQYLKDGFFDILIKMMEIIKQLFWGNFFAPWQETLADARDGEGGEAKKGSIFVSSITQYKMFFFF